MKLIADKNTQTPEPGMCLNCGKNPMHNACTGGWTRSVEGDDYDCETPFCLPCEECPFIWCIECKSSLCQDIFGGSAQIELKK